MLQLQCKKLHQKRLLQLLGELHKVIQMLLQMPSFDQRALEAKEAEFAELLNQITQIMADCEVLANRSFSDEQLQAANPHANPQLREQIADMQRDVAAVRMQGAARGWLSKRAAEKEAEAEAARIAAEPPWQEVAEERFARARVRIAETSVVLEADGSVTGAWQERDGSATGTRQELDASMTGARQEPDRSVTGARQERDGTVTGA